MKFGLVVALALLIAPDSVHGQDQYVWLRLTGNRVITNAQYVSVSAESVRVVRGGMVVAVSLDEVVQIRFMKGSSMLEGAAVGAGVGLAAGAVAFASLHDAVANRTSATTTVVAFAFVGGLVGGTVAALQKVGEVVNLNQLDAPAKALRISEAAGAKQ